MRAVLCHDHDGPAGLALADIPEPAPGRGELRLRVRAAGINFADGLMTRGRYQEKPPFPFVPGLEVAGVVDALGEGVVGFVPGERVLAVLDGGGFAEFALAKASDAVPLPDEVTFVQAAAIAINYGTALGGLEWRAALRPGETLLVHGAAGGTGLAAVEVGKAMGATVLATARGEERSAVALAHGADHAFDSEREDLRDAIRAVVGPRGVDVVFDTVGGRLFETGLRSIAWGGRLLVVGFAGGDVPQIPANILLVKNAAAIGFYWGSYRKHAPHLVRAGLEQILAWLADGRIDPVVSAVLPLAKAGEAIARLEGRQATGKLVLSV